MTAVNDGQNKHYVSVFQVTVDHTVWPYQDLTVRAIWQFRHHTTTLREIAETRDCCPDSPDHNTGVLSGITRNEHVCLTEVLKRWTGPDYCSHASLSRSISS